MRSWTVLLGGLIVWAIHFFALYIVASIFLTTPLSRGLALLVTVVCLAVNMTLSWSILRCGALRTDRWSGSVALYATGLSTLAILWQALPAVLI